MVHSTHKRTGIMKGATAVALLAVLFVLIFACVLGISFGAEGVHIQNGEISANVASAAKLTQGNTPYPSTIIDLSEVITPTTTSININPDVSKRGRQWTTEEDHTTNGTWSTGNSSTGGTWSIGDDTNHGGTDYANVWWDFDLGEYWTLSDSVSISLSADSFSYSRKALGGIIIGGAYIAINSSSTAFDVNYKGSTDDGKKLCDNEVSDPKDRYVTVTKTGKNPSSANLTHTVSGRYIRIYFVTWSGNGRYGSVSASNVKVTLNRTYKSFNFSYDKNDNDATGSVKDTPHKYMQASNVSENFFTKTNFVQTGWNTTSSALNGVSIGFNESIGTSIDSGTIGAHIRSNILNGTTTIPLYAAYKEIGFTFDGRNYATYNNEVLQVLQTKTGGNYLTAHTPPNGYTASITYKNTLNGQTVSKPTAIGYYSATITINGGGSVRGTRTISFEITSGDFGRLDGVAGVWGSANNPYVISTVQHLKNLSDIVNGEHEALNSIVGANGMTASDVEATDKSYANCYFAVTQNIGTSGNPVAITPIGNSSANAFRGTMFGGSGAYSGSKIRREIYFRITSGDAVGLFGYINGATFDTLTLMPQVNGGVSVGGLAGVAQGNCTVISVTVGSNNYGTVTATHQVGGFIGLVDGASVTVRDCVNYAAVTASGRNTVDNYRVSLGGFAGLVTANGSVTVSGSRNYGRINSTSSLENSGVGGIVGYSLGTLNISNTFNSGAVGGSQARRVGGIVGHVNKTTTLSNVSNTYYTNTFSAAISGRNYVGGIAGFLTSGTTTLSGDLTNTGSVSGTDTVGGLFGHSQDTVWGNGTFANGAQGSTATVTGSSTVGGLVGYFFGDRAENATLVNHMSVTGTSDNTGGIAGKFDWGYFPVNAVNNGAVSGLNHTGGIIGYAVLETDGSHLRKNHKNFGSVTGTNNVGGVYGTVVFNSAYPIASYPNRYISGAVNTGNVKGSSLTGGIVGYTTVAIERCKSTATVYVTASSSQYSLPTGAYAGGIVGYATQRIKNCYTSGTVATAGSVGGNYVPANYNNGTNIGGIAGRTDAVISYCYTEADVYGGENTGGIVGYMGGSTSYCYFNGHVGSVSATVSNIGYISGNGANTVSGKNYVLPLATSANNASSYKKAQAYILHSLNLSESGWSFAPRFYSNGTDANGEVLAGGWEEIVNKDVNGVEFIGVYTDGKYIRIVTDRTNTAYSAATSLNASGTTVTARYNLLSSAGDKNVYFDKIDVVCDTVKEYDASYVDWVTIRSGYELPAQYSYINRYYAKTDLDTAIDPVNAGTYTAVTDIIVGGTKVGVKTQDATITKRVITVNANEWTDGAYRGDITREGAKAFVYKNTAQGLKPISFTHALGDGNVVRSGDLTAVEFGTYTYTLTLADASNYTFTYTASGVTYGNADRIVYTYQIKPFDISTATENNIIFGYARAGKVSNNTALNIDGDYKLGTVNGLRAFLYYDATARAAASYKLKSHVSGSWELLVAGVDYEAFDIPYVDENEPLKYVTLTYRGINNFTGVLTVEYTLMIGDFGRGDWSSKWGTESNPYLIEDRAQLIRLSQIVNGTDTAWNSIAGINGASAADVNATSASYAGAFFRMTADIDMTGNYGFYPIGTAARAFSATFDGASGGAANTVTLQMVSGTDNIGFFGNLSGATVKNLEVYCNATVGDYVSGANNIGTVAGRMTDSRIIGCVGRATVVATGNNVGGIVGYASNSVISDSTNSSPVRGVENVGGIVGYANNTVISNCVVNARTSGQTSGTVRGTENVGGIVGSAVNVTLDDATKDSGTRSYANVEGSEYVGGIAGRFVTNRQFNYTPYINNGVGSATIAVIGKSFTGGIFGYFTGVGYHSEQYLNGGTALEIAASNIYIKVVSRSSASDKGSYIGGIVGFISDAGIVIGESGWDTARAFMGTAGSSSSADFDAGYANLVGGVAGALGHGAAIEAKSVYNGSGQASMPVTQITNNTTITNGGSYIGGIAGYVSQNAGAYFGARTTVFGNKIRLRNTRPVSGEGYVGGILGYIGVNASVNIDGTAASDNTIVFGPRFGENSFGAAQNVANITASGNYAGGLVGYIGKSARVEFVNEVKSAIPSSISEFAVLNGTDVTSNRTIVQAANYAGGIAGYADGESNIVTRVINIAGVWAGTGSTYNGTHAGGLFGYFAGGEISDSMSVNNVMNGNYGDLTDLYRGADYIGGLVGELRGGSIKTSYSTGFAYTSVSTSRGGVVGYKSPSAYITDSWTIYRKLDATYLDTSLNEYGKYIIIGRRIALMPSFAEMAKLAGIYGASVTVDEGRRSATGGGIVAQKGKISIAVSLSAIVSNQQAVMYDASGTETATKNDIDIDANKTNDVVYLQVDGTQDSFSVCSAAIAFENVNRFDAGSYGEDTDGAINAQNAYVRAARDDKYTAKVTSAVYDTNRYITSITANIFYKGEKVGSFYSTFNAGSDATPFLITSQDDWDNFASAIISGNGSRYSGLTVRLTANVEIIKYNNDSRFTVNGGYNFAGDITVGGGDSLSDADRNKVFTGIFDGDGHSITFRHDYSGRASRVSVFPNAANATFKNLTIGDDSLTDRIYSYDASMTREGADGRHIAAFVGKPFGSLTFENCTNNVNVEGFSVVSGFVGFSTASAKISMTACINNGNIVANEGSVWHDAAGALSRDSYPEDYPYGTGGLIAYVNADTTIESCKNTGDITAPTKVGGLIGRATNASSSGKTTLTVYNSANTGNVYGYEKNPSRTGKEITFNAWGRAGGIIGEVDQNSQLMMYTSYNTGSVTVFSSVVGGLVGILGTIPENGKPHAATSRYKSIIAYSYNTGTVTAGSSENLGIPASGLAGHNFSSTEAGGLVGTAVSVEIAYCYNTGVVKSYGGVGHNVALIANTWHARTGGIIGEGRPLSSALNIVVRNTYNVGMICIFEKGETATNGSCRFGADIVGYLDDDTAEDNTTDIDCYGIKNNIRYGANYYSGWNNQGGGSRDVVRTGETLDSLADLTAVFNSNAASPIDGMPAAALGTIAAHTASWGTTVASWESSVQTLIDANGNDINYATNGSFKNGTLNGWISVYGCLPQLAVFAVGTQSGLSMLSTTYGRNDNGRFVGQMAGSRFSPYIIKDGIDLMGAGALVSSRYDARRYHFEGKYIEFADGDNNVATDIVSGHITDTTAYIDMNTYRYAQTANGAATSKGKSYHLYELGAVVSNDPTAAPNTSYNNWKARNYRYNADDTDNKKWKWETGAAQSDINFYAIGRRGHENYFSGSISGLQKIGETIGETQIKNLKVDYASSSYVYAGLFGRVQNAQIKNIAVSGSIKGKTLATNNTSGVFAGIIAYTGGTTTVDGLIADALYIEASENNKNISSTNESRSYTGGIVGCASTIIHNMDNGKQESHIGSELNIKNCVVRNNTEIYGFKDNVGGITGFATANNLLQNLTDCYGTSVNISDCKVLSAKIRVTPIYNTNKEVGTHIGGIIGATGSFVELSVSGCSVGNETLKTPSAAANVTISGENSVGGILGGASVDTTIYSCNVYGDVLIDRLNVWSNAGNRTLNGSDVYGTAFGGIVGYTAWSGSASRDLYCLIGGNIGFYGRISIECPTNVRNDTGNEDLYTKNIGGIAGYMGSGARFERGSVVTVGGSITVNSSIDKVKNIGGIVGESSESAFSGVFTVDPSINVPKAINLGGFIGQNEGACEILADDTVIVINGSMTGKENVGGFIGYNAETGKLNIGSPMYGGTPYNGALSITVESTATISGENNVGGIVGLNDTKQDLSGEIIINKGIITNRGKVAATKDNAGGFIGNSNGVMSIVNVTGSTTDLVVTNGGAVSGANRIGGVIGYLQQGEIAGSFANTGSVTGMGEYIGGAIGYISNNSRLTASGVNTYFTNSGSVRGGGNYVGGSVGAVFGEIAGVDEHVKVVFSNEGTVDGNNYLGGNIGVLMGRANYAEFINNGKVTTSTGVNAIGGSIGIIGEPMIWENQQPHVAVSVTNTHSEYTFASGVVVTSQAPSDSGLGDTEWGGIGGVIGVISGKGNWDGAGWSDNTFYVTGGVQARNINNVGGTIGLVKKNDLTFSGLFAYDSLTVGANNVGGVVGTVAGNGVSILDSFNITISEGMGVTATAQNGQAGGIVGYFLHDDTSAETSYWVKGFASDVLKNVDIKNVRDTVGATATEACSETATVEGEDEPTTFVFTGKFCSDTSLADYLTSTGRESQINNYSGWDDYIRKLKPLYANAYQDGNDNWVVVTEGGTPYTTGTKETGWYFLFATDTEGGVKLVDTNHDDNDDLARNLVYWKRIANSYTAAERANGEDKVPLASSLVVDETQGAPNVIVKGGEVERGFIYATATVNPKSGKYLYMRTSVENPDAYTKASFHGTTDNKFYIRTSTGSAIEDGQPVKSAQNVVIFYRDVATDNTNRLVYNGYSRYVSLNVGETGVDKITYGGGSIVEGADGKDDARRNSYWYTVNVIGMNSDQLPVEAGEYKADIKIYYYGSNGTPYVVGKIDGGEFVIQKRNLDVKITGKGDEYKGEATNGEFVMTVDNIAHSDVLNTNLRLGVRIDRNVNGSLSNAIDYVYAMLFEQEQGKPNSFDFGAATLMSVKVEQSDPYITSAEKSNSYDAAKHEHVVNFANTQKLVLTFAMKNAATYKMSVILDDKQAVRNSSYNVSEVEHEIEITPKRLTLRYSVDDESVATSKTVPYVGSAYGVTVLVSGWAASDDATAMNAYRLALIRAVSPYFSYEKKGTVTQNNLNYNANGNSFMFGATDVGVYKFGFADLPSDGKLSDGNGNSNYVLVMPDNPRLVLTVTQNEITITWSAKNASREYNGNEETVRATITAKQAFANDDIWKGIVDTLVCEISSTYEQNCEGKTVTVTTARDGKNAEAVFITSKNADKYTFTVDDGTGNENYGITDASSKNNTFTITPRKLTVRNDVDWTEGSVENSYVYNTKHQGIRKIELDGFVTGENLSNTGAYGEGVGISVALSPSSFKATASDKTFVIDDAIDVGEYSATLTVSVVNSNYALDTASVRSWKWTITPYAVTVDSISMEGTSVVYDGEYHVAKISYQTAGGNGNGTSFVYGRDTVTFKLEYTYGSVTSEDGACNVGLYSIQLAGSGRVNAVRDDGKDASDNYTVDGEATASFEVSKRQIRVDEWKNKGTYVFSDSYNDFPTISKVTMVGTALPSSVSSTAVVGSGTNVRSNTSFVGMHANERVILTVTGYNKNRGKWTVSMNNTYTVSGSNAAGATNTSHGNYELITGATASAEYEVTASEIRIVRASGSVQKVYDNSISATGTNVTNTFVYRVESVNGGHVPNTSVQNIADVTPRYADKNVGTLKRVDFTVGGLKSAYSNGNYVLTGRSFSANVGTITARALTISLNLKNNGALKTYDATTLFGRASNLANETNMRSSVYRLGQGFRVSGIAAGELNGAVIVTAVFAEVERSRALFDSYINNVVDLGSGEYAVQSGHYKTLVFSFEGTSISNYDVCITSFAPTAIAADGNTMTVYDSRDAENENEGKSAIYISIEKKSVIADYSPLSQSYANSDNTPNTVWQPVGGTASAIISSDNVRIVVTNGWMYENGVSGAPKVYNRYTLIRGKAGDSLLGATLTSGDGKHLNYNLRTQPTLTIGYFVSKEGAYQVGSFAGLMLATHYYKMNFTDGFESGVVSVWNRLCSFDDYAANANIPTDITDEEGNAFTAWDEYFDAYEAANGVVVESDADRAQYGYWSEKEAEKITYTNFLQVANISGVLSKSDMDILTGEFGSNWGRGTDNLSNFLKSGVGSTVTVIGSIFSNAQRDGASYPFIGIYDGAGYTIDKVNIMGMAESGASVLNVGMFESVGSGSLPTTEEGAQTLILNGAVRDVHLRNFNIVVSNSSNITVNVGGIIGFSQQFETMQNCSFHGTITVDSSSGTVNAGGLVGSFDSAGVEREGNAIDGAISLGSIRLSGKAAFNAGGVIGLLKGRTGMDKVANTVSMTEIFAHSAAATLGGIVGRATDTSDAIDGTAVFITDSIVNVQSGATSGLAVGNVSSSAGMDVSYSELRGGSVSAYNASGEYYNYGNSLDAVARGEYDVLKDGALSFDNDGKATSTYESMRLADMIDIYMLLYSKTQRNKEIDGNTAAVYVKGTSWLVGNRTGTDDSRFAISNQQHVALLREFKFASFEMKNDVVMYTTHGTVVSVEYAADGKHYVATELAVFGDAFYGSVSANGYTVDLKGADRMFELQLSGHEVPVKISQ